LYNSIPFLLAVATNASGNSAVDYSYGLLLDNVSQTYFNLGSNDYSDMTGKYYFGALYGELDYYIMVGNDTANQNPIADVLNQLTTLTGRAAMPPKYALGYHQGCYGYWDSTKLMAAANAFRNNNIPIDGLHIDVDFQDNYRTFTSSNLKFPNPAQMFETLHDNGFKCSTNITGIISANPFDENGSTEANYPTRDSILNLNQCNAALSTYKQNAEVHPFIYNTRYNSGEDPNIFIANEGYGQNVPANPNYNNYPSPSPQLGTCPPQSVNNNTNLGTYGFYCDMGNPDVQKWWGEQYDYLLSIGMDMIWQDMTDPAVVPNDDNNCDDKTLPLDLMMYDSVTQQYQPNAAVHNAFAINLIKATYEGISKLKSSPKYQNTYNYQKRNFIIARGGYTGVHRYAGIWTGDSATSWDFLSINVPEVLNVGLSAQPISGCDIGGFANGSGSTNFNNGIQVTEPELLVRWMNCGAFLPWYRNHYDGYTKSFQEPYAYGDPYMSYCRTYIEMRYQLIQLFYDAMYECTQTGMPVARAMFLNEANDIGIFSYLNTQFFVGKDLLVAPVVTQGSTSIDVYLPAGSNWYVFDITGGVLVGPTPGGKAYTWYVPLGLVPVYVREGAIIPVKPVEQYVGQVPTNPITFFIYPGKDSSYQLYQDDEISTAFQKTNTPEYRLTAITTQTTGNTKTIDFTRTYDNFTPPADYFNLSLFGYTQAPTSVTVAGTLITSVNSLVAFNAATVNSYFFDSVNEKCWLRYLIRIQTLPFR